MHGKLVNLCAVSASQSGIEADPHRDRRQVQNVSAGVDAPAL
jgi:hypothetical protein